MRFLQGAGGSAASGIPCVRGKYVRPLLWTDRASIEAYLNDKGVEWRTDSTNEDTRYLRNKIRHELVPFLNRTFGGWDSAVMNGAEKALDDAEVLNQTAQEYFDRLAQVSPEQVSFSGADFYTLPRALKTRLILLAANSLGVDVRIPYVFLRDICDCADNYIEENSQKKGGGQAVKAFAGLEVVLQKKGVFVKKASEIQNEIVFSAIIEQSGVYEIPFGQVYLPQTFDYPVMLRSWHTDDFVQTADGGFKKVSDVLSSWHVSQKVRCFIPVVQALKEPEQRILAVLGSCQGYKDWIVKNEKM